LCNSTQIKMESPLELISQLRDLVLSISGACYTSYLRILGDRLVALCDSLHLEERQFFFPLLERFPWVEETLELLYQRQLDALEQFNMGLSGLRDAFDGESQKRAITSMLEALKVLEHAEKEKAEAIIRGYQDRRCSR
jgi:hypothetical protein